MEKKKLSKKQRVRLLAYLRAGIQCIFFFLIPSAFTAAFSGAKYVMTQIGLHQQIEWTAFIAALIGLCSFTIIFGRFFCGYACAFGSLGDALHAIYIRLMKKIKRKPWALSPKISHRLEKVKYGVLIIILLLCFTGLHEKTRGMSPWDVFSMVQSGNFKLSTYIPGCIILGVIMIGMFLEERFFCKFLCPMGAIFAMLPILPFFSLKRKRQECFPKCKACNNICPAHIDLMSGDELAVNGECFQCQKCIEVCPRQHIHCGLNILKGNEVFWTIYCAILLFCLCMWIGL